MKTVLVTYIEFVFEQDVRMSLIGPPIRIFFLFLVLPFTMAALRSRCGHYIFALWFLSIFFIPRLISAVADWMSTIL